MACKRRDVKSRYSTGHLIGYVPASEGVRGYFFLDVALLQQLINHLPEAIGLHSLSLAIVENISFISEVVLSLLFFYEREQFFSEGLT